MVNSRGKYFGDKVNEITEMIAKVEIFTGKLVVFETRD